MKIFLCCGISLYSYYVKGLKVKTTFAVILVLTGLVFSNVFGSVTIKNTFPKIAGMNIGAKNFEDSSYQNDLSRCDIVILGFTRGWKRGGITPKSVVASLKEKNPYLLAGMYTILNEAYDDTSSAAVNKDVADILYKQNWWLHDSTAKKVQWTTAYSSWEINFTEFTQPDSKGRRYPQWLAERNYGLYFNDIPFDIWYFDNVMSRPRTHGNYNLVGRNNNPNDPNVQTAFRRGMAAEWTRARELKPDIIFMGNPDGDLSEPEYVKKLNGAFLEGQMGLSWSIEKNAGWNKMMQNYHSVISNTLDPKLVIFNVQGNKGNYKFMRYALTSTLMDDGYFCFTDTAKGYSSIPWFDEYNANLGVSIDEPQFKAWQKGVYCRKFENGMVLVNPKGNGMQSVNVGSGYKRLQGSQDVDINNGKPVVDNLTIPEADGIILVKMSSSH